MGRPILFRQRRIGLNGKPFTLYKYRTMLLKKYKNNDLISDEKRLTKIGLFLRKTSLDELPGLWNIVIGDMNFIGPRPLLEEYLALYSNEQMRRHNIKPGITGWAQINGRNLLSWKKKFDLDIWYVDNQSLLLDLRIIIYTIWKVLKREGVTTKDDLSMPKFNGRN